MSADMQPGEASEQVRSGAEPRIVTLVGFGRRLLAGLYDGFLIALLSFTVAFIIGFIATLLGIFDRVGSAPVELVIVLSCLVVSALYYIGTWRRSGQTIGKLLTGTKVVSRDGSLPSWPRALARYAGYLVSAAALSLGFLWIAFDPKRQGWHDRLAGTYVVGADDFSGGAAFAADESVRLVPAEQPRRWIWVVAWAALAIVWPLGLLSIFWVLGPAMGVIWRGVLGGAP